MPKRCSEPRRAAPLAALLAGLLCACAPLTLGEEQQLGYQVEQQMRRELLFLNDRVVSDYVSDLGERLVAASGPQAFQYHFYVVLDPEINASAAPAGHVYVNTGTILEARNVSELAGVMAHEVGHVVRRHIANNYNRRRNTQVGANLLVAAAAIVAGGGAANLASFGSGVAAMAYLNSFGREAENEADVFAVEVLPKAGYHPEGLASFFETLVLEGQGQSASFLSSHPATQDRIDATRAAIGKLPSLEGLAHDDGGKLEIIQRRIQILTGATR